MNSSITITKRYLREFWIIFLYKLNKFERKYSEEEIDIDYSLNKRWKLKSEHQKSVAFAFTTIQKVTGEQRVWVHEIQVIRDKDKGKGLGSYLLRQIIKCAAERQLPVALFADPGGVGGVWLNQEELTNWYAKYGFVKEGGAMILRTQA